MYHFPQLASYNYKVQLITENLDFRIIQHYLEMTNEVTPHIIRTVDTHCGDQLTNEVTQTAPFPQKNFSHNEIK